jgi:ribosomal protein L20
VVFRSKRKRYQQVQSNKGEEGKEEKAVRKDPGASLHHCQFELRDRQSMKGDKQEKPNNSAIPSVGVIVR